MPGRWLGATIFLTALQFVLCLLGAAPWLETGGAFVVLLLDMGALCTSPGCFVLALFTKDVTGAERSLISTVAALAAAGWHWPQLLAQSRR